MVSVGDISIKKLYHQDNTHSQHTDTDHLTTNFRQR